MMLKNLLGEVPHLVKLTRLVTPTGEMPLQVGAHYRAVRIEPDGLGLEIETGWQCESRTSVSVHPSEFEVVEWRAAPDDLLA